MKTREMEVILASYFDFSKNLIVPNVSWGLGLHECDLIVMSKAGYLTEVEIKVSAGDLKKDQKKRHQHKSDKIKNLYFAIPSKLMKYWEYIPNRAGIISVTSKGYPWKIANPKPNKNARPLTEEEQFKLARLGIFRIWHLKRRLDENIKNYRTLKNKLEKQEKLCQI